MSDTLLNPLTQQPILDSEIKELAELVESQIKLEDEVQDLEERLENRKKALTQLSDFLIPNKLDLLGLSSIRLSNGAKVEIKPFYNCSIVSDTAFQWLDEHQHGGLIKTKVFKDFPRTAREEAIKYQRENPGFTLKEEIHWATLRAFTKEIYENGGSLPPEQFNVFQGKKTKIVRK